MTMPVSMTYILLLLAYVSSHVTGLFIREAMRMSAGRQQAEPISIGHMFQPRAPRVKRVAKLVTLPQTLHLVLGGPRRPQGAVYLQKIQTASTTSDLPGGFPIFKIGETGPERVAIPSRLVPPRAFYRQVNNSGILVVSRSSATSLGFTLDGTLTLDSQEYVISPRHDGDGVQAGGLDHMMKQINSTLDQKARDVVIEVDDKGRPLSFSKAKHQVKKLFGRRKKDKRYIELAMVADFSSYQKFVSYTGDRPLVALMEMYLYYGFVTLSASLRYETITAHHPDLVVTLVARSLFVCTFRRFCPWSEENRLNGTNKLVFGRALKDFRKYVNSDKGPKGDHRMMFTGYRLSQPNGKTGVIGVAYLGTGCGSWGVSLVQEFYTSVTSAVAAHELGHSFSARHDTDPSSVGCSNSEFYAMAAYLGFPTNQRLAQHPYSFSNCSADSIRSHLKSSRGQCTKNKPDFSIKTQFIAGQFYNADAQCAFARGDGSTFCRTFQELRKFDKMCVRTFCSDPKRPPHCVGIIPLHRTSCGNMRWCEEGRCVRHIDAPATPHDRCPQGDDPTIPCSLSLCTTDTYINILCCDTCQGVPLPTTTPTPTTTQYPPSCGKVCQCLIQTSTVLCFFKCVANLPC